MLTLRPYQQEAVDATMKQLNKSPDPGFIDASVSAGQTLLCSCLFEIMEGGGPTALLPASTAELVGKEAGGVNETRNKAAKDAQVNSAGKRTVT